MATPAHRTPRPTTSDHESPTDPPRRSAFPRYERWLFAAALVGISIWGFTGLDMGVLNATDDAATSVSDSSAVDWGSTSTPSGGAAARGKAVFEANGCMACHSIDGSKKIGPSLKGIWGTEQVHADGSTAVMDEDYFKESVLEPQARIVEGYGSAMPSYQDLVTPEELAELAAYVKSLQ